MSVFAYLDYRAALRDLYAHKKATEYGFSYRAVSKRAGLRSITSRLKSIERHNKARHFVATVHGMELERASEGLRRRPGPRPVRFTSLAGPALVVIACAAHEPEISSPPPAESAPSASEPVPTASERAPAPPDVPAVPPDEATPSHSAGVWPACQSSDWTKRSLPALLEPGKTANPEWPDQPSATAGAFDRTCSDSPSGPREADSGVVLLDGVEVRLTEVAPAGLSGRQWPGNQCTFELRLADGSGRPVELGPDEVPPFTSVTSLVRAGSAVWLELSFNGYTSEFPNGGNRIIAVDLCDGRVAWKSADGVANGGLLLAGDYLISAFGFTNERRSVFVLDAYSGEVVQKLPIRENICPSKSWAPHWDGGRCDAPGQLVGAAGSPRIEDGLFLVDTNTGSSAFELIATPVRPALDATVSPSEPPIGSAPKSR